MASNTIVVWFENIFWTRNYLLLYFYPYDSLDMDITDIVKIVQQHPWNIPKLVGHMLQKEFSNCDRGKPLKSTFETNYVKKA
jgi:hypothetical protein